MAPEGIRNCCTQCSRERDWYNSELEFVENAETRKEKVWNRETGDQRTETEERRRQLEPLEPVVEFPLFQADMIEALQFTSENLSPAFIEMFIENVHWYGRIGNRYELIKQFVLDNYPDWPFNGSPLKFLSHWGAVRVSKELRDAFPGFFPITFCDEDTHVSYSDVTNKTYSIVFNMLWPTLKDYGWSPETKGDVIEALLGWCFLRRRRFDGARDDDFCEKCRRYLEFISVYVHANWQWYYDSCYAN